VANRKRILAQRKKAQEQAAACASGVEVLNLALSEITTVQNKDLVLPATTTVRQSGARKMTKNHQTPVPEKRVSAEGVQSG